MIGPSVKSRSRVVYVPFMWCFSISIGPDAHFGQYSRGHRNQCWAKPRQKWRCIYRHKDILSHTQWVRQALSACTQREGLLPLVRRQEQWDSWEQPRSKMEPLWMHCLYVALTEALKNVEWNRLLPPSWVTLMEQYWEMVTWLQHFPSTWEALPSLA